jgi:hypothetical protein
VVKNWYSNLFPSSLVLVAVLLFACNTKKGQLAGTWQIDKLEINGTGLPGDAIGNPDVTFHNDGSYTMNIGAYTEKGTYSLEGKELVYNYIRSRNTPDSPFITKTGVAEKVFAITEMDSAHMAYTANSKNDKTTTYLHKVQE